VRVKDKLALLKFIIYISFDLWSLSNSLGLIIIIVYFLNKNLKNRSLLINMRRIKGSYNNENIAKAIIPILVEIGIVSKFNFFITNNVIINDIAINLIL
jgi:hypothetical protein